MSDIVEQLQAHAGFIENGGCADHGMTDEPWLLREAADEIKRLRAVIGWVDAWVSNEVNSYSIYALDGLFRMTREKIAALPSDIAVIGDNNG